MPPLIVVIAEGSGGGLCMLFMFVPLAVYLLVKGMESASRQLLIDKTPTSECGHVSPGLVEVKATVVTDEPMDSPLTDSQVVYYEYSVEEQQGSQKSWISLGTGKKQIPFYLRDETGRIRVDPEDAEFHPRSVVDHSCGPGHPLYEKGPEATASSGRRKFKESHIAAGDEVYVLGTVGERQDLAIPEIRRAHNDDPFVISTVDESYLANQYAAKAKMQLLGGAAFALVIPVLGTMVVQQASFGEALELAIVPIFVIGLGIGAFIWALYRIKHHEHIEDLKRRMERAQSLLRRECAHRQKLATQILQYVRKSAAGSRFRGLEVAAEKLQKRDDRATENMAVSEICPTINDQSDALDEVFAIVEDLPDLQSDQQFFELLEELTRCEKQLMMARNFYNDGQRRIADEPEGAIGEARYSRGRRGPKMLTFKKFERKPVDIVLPEDPRSEYGGSMEREQRAISEPDSDQPETYMGMPVEGRANEKTPTGPPAIPDHQRRAPAEHDVASESTATDTAAEDLDDTLETEAIDVGMEFGNAQSFDAIDEFGDIGRFGVSRRFDDLVSDDDKKTGRKREHFGFAKDEKAGLADIRWESKRERKRKVHAHFGFSDEDRRSVLDAFADDDPPERTE